MNLRDQVDALKIRNEKFRAENERLETNVLHLQLLDDNDHAYNNHNGNSDNDKVAAFKVELVHEKAKNMDETGLHFEQYRSSHT